MEMNHLLEEVDEEYQLSLCNPIKLAEKQISLNNP